MAAKQGGASGLDVATGARRVGGYGSSPKDGSDFGPSRPTSVIVSPAPVGAVRPAPMTDPDGDDGLPVSKVVS